MDTRDSFLQHRLSKRLDMGIEVNTRVQQFLTSISTLQGEWRYVVKNAPALLDELQKAVIISSTGASTRIEGATMSDEEVERFLKQSHMRKLSTRDQQEVAGYLDAMQTVFDNFDSIDITVSTVKQIHSVALKYSEKDHVHRGDYKKASNKVIAVNEQGKQVGVIFSPSVPHAIPQEMEELFQWVKRAFERDIFHPLLITANTVFEFLCIHPFKDGNGRVSRVLTNLLLLKTGYDFTRYASHEKLIEGSKVDYYLALRKSTKSWRSGREDVSAWTVYFLDIVLKQIQQAVKLIRQQDISLMLSERQRRVWELFVKKSDLSRKEIHEATAIPLATVEQIVRKLVSMHVIEQYGEARAARYRMKRMMPPFTSEIM